MYGIDIVFENGVLRKMFGHKRGGGNIKLEKCS
jgi:hypothetical protein